MIDILIKAFGFILIIFIGFYLKSKGICKREHGQFLSTVIMNITLPCALLSSINNIEITFTLLIALFIGLFANIITNIVGYYISRNDKPMDQALAMINMSGFNIGTFTLPFVQSFFPASALIYVLMFDTGNSLMCLGGTFSLASSVVNEDDKTSFYSIIKKLFSSIPFCTYIVLFILSLLHISIPQRILNVTSIAGNANPFLAMLMIGIMLEVKLDLSELKTIKKLIIARYTVCSIIALLIYVFLSVDTIMKKMLVLVMFAPVSGVAPIFSNKLGSKSPVPAAINSISIMISICILTCLILVFA
jgi:predicted permease